jgi:glycosyltransferase involved in cell wall biosynthesis
MSFNLTIDARMIGASGVGRYLRSLLPYLCRHQDFSVTLLGKKDELARYGICSGSSRVMECSSRIYTLSEQFELARNVPGKCDLFWSPHYNVPLLPTRAKKRLVTIHDVFHLAFFHTLSLKQKVYARLMFDASVRLSNKIITDSQFSKSEIVRYTGADASRIRVVLCGIDKKTFKVIETMDKLKHLKSCYNLPDRFILFVGNLKPHKNLANLLKAFDILVRQKAVDCGLVIAGKKEGFISEDNELRTILENNADLRKRVVLTGYIEDRDVPLIYNLASVSVLPSLYEGFGLPPLESMACGCPAVVSDIPSIREVCGDAAYYVDPYDVENIADGLCRTLNDENLRTDLLSKGAERIKLFSWESSAAELIRIFTEVMDE